MAPEVLKPRIKQLVTLTGVKVKRVRHDGAKEYVTNDLKAWYEEKGTTSEMTAPYKAQQNDKAERVNRTLMERVRPALLDDRAKEELWAEALVSVVHVLNRSPKAGLAVTPLEALTGRRPNVAGFRVWKSRAWPLKPNKQQRKLEPRTDVGRFVGYTVRGKAYRILDDETNQVFERRDVLMEENSAKVETSAVGSSAGPRLTAEYDGDKEGATEGAMDMLGAEGGQEDEYSPDDTSDSDNEVGPPSFAGDSQEEDEDGVGSSTPAAAQAPAASDSVTLGPRRSKRNPAPNVTWWEKVPKAYLASGNASAAEAGWYLHKAPENEKEARAGPDWPLWKQAIEEEVAAHKQFGTWSKTKGNNKNHKAIKTRFVFNIKQDAEGKLTRYEARLVAQGFNQVPGRDFDETWAPVPNTATTRALFAVSAAMSWEIHYVDVKTAFLNTKMEKEMYIKLPVGVKPEGLEEMCQLDLALYGTKQAGRLWGIKLDKELKEMGAVRSKVDPCLYEWHHLVHGCIVILVNVDDLIVAGEKLAGVEAVKRSVSATFEVRHIREVRDFIGMKVMRNRAAKTLTLTTRGTPPRC